MSRRLALLDCSQCPVGRYRPDDSTTPGDATCDHCGHAVNVMADIAPHLDINEMVTTHTYPVGGIIVRRLAVVTTEACECCGSISDAHFSVGPPRDPQPCPNDTDR